VNAPPRYLLSIKHLQGECSYHAMLDALKRLSVTVRLVVNKRIVLFDAKNVEELLEEIYYLPCSEGLFVNAGYIDDLVCDAKYCTVKMLFPNMSGEERNHVKNALYKRGFREGRGKTAYIIKWLSRPLVYLPLLELRRDRFKPRSPERRIYFISSSLNPPTALLLVNASLSRNSENLLDPFAGAGGVLIEAALRGLYVVGVELDYRHIRGALRNIKQYELSSLVDLVLADSTRAPFRRRSFDAIATDPPYGRYASTHGEKVETIYNALKSIAANALRRGGRCAFFSPSNVLPPYSDALTLSKKCEIYIHSGLTRTLWVYYA